MCGTVTSGCVHAAKQLAEALEQLGALSASLLWDRWMACEGERRELDCCAERRYMVTVNSSKVTRPLPSKSSCRNNLVAAAAVLLTVSCDVMTMFII